LHESSNQAPTPDQLAALQSDRDTLHQTLTQKDADLKALQTKHEALTTAHTALEKDTKTTTETLKALQADHAKLKDSHTAEIQKSRLEHSKAAELHLENKTLFSRVEELKQKLVTLTSEKLELVDRTETQEAELFKLRKAAKESVAGGGKMDSVEVNAELDALIEGAETRRVIRETNQRRYSQFVGQTAEGESAREVNERRLKRGKDSGEFGREREVGFVVDLIAGGGGCGMCTGDVLVL
jgi:chromosome segregation ATPase